jgi:hypothetical protein
LGPALFDSVGLGVGAGVGAGLGTSRGDGGGDGVADGLAIGPFEAGAIDEPQAARRIDATIKAGNSDNDRISRTLVANCRDEMRRLPPENVTNLLAVSPWSPGVL